MGQRGKRNTMLPHSHCTFLRDHCSSVSIYFVYFVYKVFHRLPTPKIGIPGAIILHARQKLPANGPERISHFYRYCYISISHCFMGESPRVSKAP
jgi:hypothetical protein